FAVPAEGDGADVTGIHAVDAYEFQHCLGKFLGGITKVLDAVNLGRIHHAADVLTKTEDGRTGRRRVAADAFKYGASVVNHVRKNVNFRVLPSDEAAVMPDFLGGRQHANNYSVAGV